MAGTVAVAEDITNPPTDELLERTSSTYAPVIYTAKRVRQINAYYSQLGQGLLEYAGPLVDTQPGKAAVHRRARDQQRPAHIAPLPGPARPGRAGRTR